MTNDKEDEELTRRMFSSFSHELKTPLASMIGSLEVLDMMHTRLSDEKRAILIETSLQESRRLDRYVSNILELSRLELGLVNTQIEKISIEDALSEAIMLCNRLKHEAKINLININENIYIESDLKLLSRMINIIIENAIIHSVINKNSTNTPNKTGGNVIIDISCDKENNNLELIIRDHGIGIPIESFDEIFKRYARIRRPNHKTNGTGLGLAIAKEIGKLLNIDINVSNHIQGGAVFKIIFL